MFQVEQTKWCNVGCPPSSIIILAINCNVTIHFSENLDFFYGTKCSNAFQIYFTRFTIKTFPDDESVNLKHVEIVEMD
jgi:hypothetical protein